MTFRGHLFRPLLGVIALFYLCAAIAMPFAHRDGTALADHAPTTTGLTDYALPDGTIPVLCLGGREGEPRSGLVSGAVCDACLLAHAPGLPAAPSAALTIRTALHAAVRPVRSAVVRRPRLVSACPRGPPPQA